MAEYFDNLQIDTRQIELSPQYYRPPWTEIDQSKFDFELCTIQRESSNRRFQAETTRLLDEKYRLHFKVYTDRSKRKRGSWICCRITRKNDKKKTTTQKLNI
jgi:hypothetical protein